MKNIFLLTVMLLAACSTTKPNQPVSTAPAALP
ncbi:MAG: hypothetical protein H6R26_2692, partial [Proteobacteria bacterium]|nr:hypothetical protein [Pseudomonadota bacterium]